MIELWRKNVYRHKPDRGPWTLIEADAICRDNSQYGGSHAIHVCVTARAWFEFNQIDEFAIAWGEDREPLRSVDEVTDELLQKMVRKALSQLVADHVRDMVQQVSWRDGAFNSEGHRPEPTT